MKKRILCVECNSPLQSAIAEYLTISGYDVICADHAKQALHLINNEWFDLVITAIELPETDGIEVARQIKANQATAHIPIIGMTALLMNRTQQLLSDTIFDSFRLKPFAPDDLLHLVQSHTH